MKMTVSTINANMEHNVWMTLEDTPVCAHKASGNNTTPMYSSYFADADLDNVNVFTTYVVIFHQYRLTNTESSLT